LKVLGPGYAATSEARQRFQREAKSAASIRHDNIVQVYAVSDRPLPYLVMEYIAGETLQDRLERTGPFGPAAVVRIGCQIASGLAAAHHRGLIHRDIKLSNILLDPGVDERIKITDFGLARLTDDASISHSGVIAGTPLYMSPEQIQGEKLDGRSDLFSLGTVLYTLLSGTLPFHGTSTLSAIMSVCESQPQPLQEVVPTTPVVLIELISRLHAKRPDERFQNAKDVFEALRLCDVSPIHTSPSRNTHPSESSLSASAATLPDDSLKPIAGPSPASDTGFHALGNHGSKARLKLSLAVTLLASLAVISATIFLASNQSEFIIETESPEVSARLDDNHGLVVVDRQTGRRFPLIRGKNQLPIGDYELEIFSPEGYEFTDPRIMVKRFGSAVATIRARPNIADKSSQDTLPLTNHALEFISPRSCVEIPTLRRANTGPFTVEMYLNTKPQLDDRKVLGVLFSLEGTAAYQLQREHDETIVSMERSWGKETFLRAKLDPQSWHHVACVLDDREHRVYIDGVLGGQIPRISFDKAAPFSTDNSTVTLLGSQAFLGEKLFHGADCYMDEIRISDCARYKESFVPSTRFESDENTVALYHCDESLGETLRDASGHEHHGTLVGAKWTLYADQTLSPPLPPARDPHGELANYLIQHHEGFDCTVLSTGQARLEVRKAEQIPQEPFVIHSVSLRGSTNAEVKSVVDLAEGRVPFRYLFLSSGTSRKPVSGAVLKELVRLPSLQNVGLARLSPFSIDDLEVLAQLPNLSLLNLEDAPFGDEVIRRLDRFPNVTQLLLNACGVTDEGLRPLSTSSVQRLYLLTPHLTDAACEILADVPQLEELSILDSGDFTGKALNKLQNLPLRFLHFHRTGLDDDALKSLKEFPQLESLALRNNGISDEGLPHLYSLPLKVLLLDEPRLTEAAVQRLRDAQPNCQIEVKLVQPSAATP
jgi:serine/threonine protein kinase/tellurite resistance-related uncharacterized protein